MCIYIYIKRARDRKRKRERDRACINDPNAVNWKGSGGLASIMAEEVYTGLQWICVGFFASPFSTHGVYRIAPFAA